MLLFLSYHARSYFHLYKFVRESERELKISRRQCTSNVSIDIASAQCAKRYWSSSSWCALRKDEGENENENMQALNFIGITWLQIKCEAEERIKLSTWSRHCPLNNFNVLISLGIDLLLWKSLLLYADQCWNKYCKINVSRCFEICYSFVPHSNWQIDIKNLMTHAFEN
jgi:hypothetical protein